MEKITILALSRYGKKTSHLFAAGLGLSTRELSANEIQDQLEAIQGDIAVDCGFLERSDKFDLIQIFENFKHKIRILVSYPVEFKSMLAQIEMLMEKNFRLDILCENFKSIQNYDQLMHSNVRLVLIMNEMFDLQSEVLSLKEPWLSNAFFCFFPKSFFADHYLNPEQILLYKKWLTSHLKFDENRFLFYWDDYYTCLKPQERNFYFNPCHETYASYYQLNRPHLFSIREWKIKKSALSFGLLQDILNVYLTPSLSNIIQVLYGSALRVVLRLIGETYAAGIRLYYFMHRFCLFIFYPIRKFYWFCSFQYENRIVPLCKKLFIIERFED